MDNSILYGGYQYDYETGLYYLNARMYNPITARFLQEDTYAGNRTGPLSLNFTSTATTNRSDPTGHRRLNNMVYVDDSGSKTSNGGYTGGKLSNNGRDRKDGVKEFV